MHNWWDTKQAAWGVIVLSVAIGGTFSYLKPCVGIPILVILFAIGVWLIWRAYRQKPPIEVMPENQSGIIAKDKPSIRVTPRLVDDDYYLEVENSGAPAVFECQIKICQDNTGHRNGELYLGYWEFANSDKASIMNIDRVKIAHIKTVTYPRKSDPIFPCLMSLHLYFYDKAFSRLNFWDSEAWSPMQKGGAKPGYILNITISSTPSAREGKFNQDYRLDFEGLVEVKTLAVNKKGSQMLNHHSSFNFTEQ